MILKKKRIKRIKVSTLYSSFWVKNPEKIDFWNYLGSDKRYDVRIIKTEYEK